MIIEEHSATDAFLQLLDNVNNFGEIVTPRDLRCKELLNVTTKIPMRKPIVTVPAREIGYRFMFAEAYWILSGDSRVETIAPYSKTISKFSDDGIYFFGAYGPKIQEQFNHVIRALAHDPYTRQAVLTIWRENPPETKDVPCTISVQFLIRNGKLHVIDNMRSSDIWLGWPYDVFNFTMLAGYVALHLHCYSGINMELGDIYMNLGSAHLYEPQWRKAYFCVEEEVIRRKPRKFHYPHFEPLKLWERPLDFAMHLKNVAKQKPELLKCDWVNCVARGDHNKQKGQANDEGKD